MYSRTGSTDWKIQLPASATAHQHRWIVDQPAVTEKCHGIPCNDMTVITRGFEIEGSGINWNIRTLLSGDKTHTHAQTPMHKVSTPYSDWAPSSQQRAFVDLASE